MTALRIAWLMFLPFVWNNWSADAADFTIETPGGIFAFQINGQNVPTLTLLRGHTYTFDVKTSNIHPFHIESLGVENNDINDGLMTFTVPTNNANYYYHCVIHGAQMRGEITTIAPPHIEILKLSVGTNLVLTSTATNNWNVYPEYSTNLSETNWFALTVQSNRFVNGSRETICGRPEGDSVFIRIKSAP
ncbi:MAG: hypothetical protein WDM80_06590 [Limisphaerales bacterium]